MRTLLVLLLLPALLGGAERPNYPASRVEGTQSTFFGTTVNDPYRWLEPDSSSEVRSWSKAQNKLARSVLDAFPERDKIKEELAPLLRAEKVSHVQVRGGRIFYERSTPDKEQGVVYIRDVQTGVETAAVDLSADKTVVLGHWTPSPDGKWMLYATHPNNTTLGTLHLWSADTGTENVSEQIPWADYADLSWDSNSAGFYYTRLPVDSKIPVSDYPGFSVVSFHKLGTSPQTDVEIFPASGDPGVYLKPQASPDGRWLFISAIQGWASSKIYFRENQPNAKFRPLFESEGSMNSVVTLKDKFFLLTNENAPRGKVVETDMNPGAEPSWSTIIPESKESTIKELRVFGQRLVLLYTKNASSNLAVYESDGSGLRYVSLPVSGSVEQLNGSVESDTAYFSFESFAVPPEVRELSISKADTKVWFRSALPLNYYKVKVDLRSAISKDGQPVSFYLLRRSNFDPKKRLPVLFRGYGGFGVPMEPRYSPMLLALIDRGWAVAIVHCRGGGEYGEAWHQGGMLTKKQNTFNDMFAAVDGLMAERVADKTRLAIDGGSNGGLLVAAAVVQRPSLFKAAVARSPITDMLRFPTCGEGKSWITEYGSPNDERQFNALYSYSPYHWVEKGTAYPSFLIVAGENDQRVCAWHSRKLAAALQTASNSSNPVLLLTDHGGHQGDGLVSGDVDEMVDRVSFLLQQVTPPVAH
jgi:prolyl oligopeptidase